MANEATLLIETHLPIPFTVADATGITKGAVLKMTDPMTAAASAAGGDIVAGIASQDKIASDGVTQLGLYRGGIFKVYISGSVAVGDPLVTTLTYPNHLSSAYVVQGATSGSKIWGFALETGTNGETIKAELRPGNIGI